MQGRTAVITGTARPTGIGQACAKLLYKNGYNIVGIDNAEHVDAADAPWLTSERQQAAAAAAGMHYPETQTRCEFMNIDLSKPDSIFSVPGHLQMLGPALNVTVLVNNAGIANPYMQSDSLAERAAMWQDYIATNLTAPFLLSEALLPMMVQPVEGPAASIIHISSTRALQSEPQCEVSCLENLFNT
jgi:NAD(P)-dependent dehydrogenase (short-subunit alcohol dehydrogenase family)